MIYPIWSKTKNRVLMLAMASAFAVAPWGAEAAGLGKITVLSGLGQPLRAELEVNASREELAEMTARLAPEAAFRQAGVEFGNVLSDLRFTMDKRTDGKPVVRVTSSKVVNEPFLDFLVELSWASGRLVREYTFLLDPPDVVLKPAARNLSVADPKVVPGIPASSVVAVNTATAASTAASPASAAKPLVATPPVPAPEKRQEAAAENESPAGRDPRMTKTRPGDTLSKIAGGVRHEGATLEQMLVGIYQANPDAFIGNNINRLKTGVVVSIPDSESIAALSHEEARQVLLTQSGQWNAYRQKLANTVLSAPARGDSSSQQVSGKITARVEEKSLPAEKTKDQVKVSRNETNQKSVGKPGASDEDLIARDRALKETQARLQMLEKNVSELQKLLEMKNQQLAELQAKQAGKGAAPAASAALTPPASKPAEPEVKPATPSSTVDTPDAAKSSTQSPAVPESTEKPADKPLDQPPVKPPVSSSDLLDDEPEANFLETLMADPMAMAGGGGVLVLLLAYVLVKRRQSAKPASSEAVVEESASQNAAVSAAEFSQTGPGTIDTDEVDPVAEADVYIAYGRDAQAEEILLEALQKDPQRIAIHSKLLEIYAARSSLKQYETLATELHALTGGKGPEWQKAAEVGATIDPANPLYASTLAAAPATITVPAAPVLEPVALVGASDTSIADALQQTLEGELPDQEVAAEAPLAELDFDLGETLASDHAEVTEAAPSSETPPVSAPEETGGALDFDLGLEMPAEAAAPLADEALEFAFDIDAPVAEEVTEEVAEDTENALDVVPDMPVLEEEEAVAVAEPVPVVDTPIEIDLPDRLEVDESVADLPEDVPLEEADPAPAFDMAAINLDLSVAPEEPELPALEDEEIPEVSVPAIPPPATATVDAAQREEITTKLDLAKAYEEMGDLEGARELLGEVAAEGPPDLADEANEILLRIGN